MATRGTPLPFALRQAIKARRLEHPVRTVARELRLSKTTVQKYGKQNGTK